MRQGFWRLASALVALAAAGAVLWLLGPWPSSLLETARAGRQPLRVGYAIEEPFAYLDASGSVTGESPEIMRRALAGIGVTQVDWRHVEFPRLLHELELGRIDAIAAGLYITPEREARALFTRPTIAVRPGLMVRDGNPMGLHSFEDVARHSLARVAVLSGSVEAGTVASIGVPADRVLALPDAQSAVAALNKGQVDAVALSAPSLSQALASSAGRGLMLVEDFAPRRADGSLERGWPALVFRREDRDLRDAVDAWLADFVGSPEHVRMEAYFGFTVAEVQEARDRGRAAEGKP